MDPRWVMCKDVWLENIDEPRMGDMEGLLVGNFDWTPAGGSGREFGNLNSPWLGGSEGFLVGKRKGEALRGEDGDVAGQSER